MPAALILASASSSRRLLLERLGLAFEVIPANIDEAPRPGESAPALVARLAQEKAAAVAARFPTTCIIGSDQVALVRGKIVGKPGSASRCIEQLTEASGQTVQFLTAVCVLCAGHAESHVDETRVVFRQLARREIERYVEREQPFDCAGGFKAESLGIALFERIESQDPTALIGLPLIWLAGALTRAGLSPL